MQSWFVGRIENSIKVELISLIHTVPFFVIMWVNARFAQRLHFADCCICISYFVRADTHKSVARLRPLSCVCGVLCSIATVCCVLPLSSPVASTALYTLLLAVL